MMTADECLRLAWAALLRGDTAARDRYCKLAENIIRAGERVRASGNVNDVVAGEPITVQAVSDVIALPDRSKELLQ